MRWSPGFPHGQSRCARTGSLRVGRSQTARGQPVRSEPAQNVGVDFGVGGSWLPCRAVPEEPRAELPDEIMRDEAAVVLFGLDVVEEADVDPGERTKVTRAIHLPTAKLWPELGDLLDGDEPS